MTIALSILIFSVCIAAMAVGLIVAKKTLKKGCSEAPEDCACRTEGKDPTQCDN
jgi:hypothetical protein